MYFLDPIFIVGCLIGWEKMNKTLYFVFDCNRDYERQTATMLYSVRKNIPRDYRLFCYYLYYQEEKANTDLFCGVLNKNTDKIIPVCVPNIFSDASFGRWNSQVAIRMLAPYFLPEEVDFYVRLDGDIVANGNLLSFWETVDTDSNYIIYATKECLPWNKEKPVFKYLHNQTYVNAGSIIVNRVNWLNIFPTLESLRNSINNLPFKLTSFDQDSINFLFNDYIFIFNDDRYMRFCDKYHIISKPYRANRPVIYHFAGNHKPWNTIGNPKYRHIWWKYANNIYPFSLKFMMHSKRFVYVILYLYRFLKRRFRF